MKKALAIVFACFATIAYSQKASDLFSANDVKVSWLGVDFSHVKLIGDFAHFYGIGEKRSWQIKDHYFPSWNRLISNEREKYDIKGMLRRSEIYYDLDVTDLVNENTPLGDLESYNNPNYSKEDIAKFVTAYEVSGKKGIGVVLVAESLNKSETEAYFHFVAFNMNTKEVLIHQRLRGEPKGFGIRNYWAGAIHDVIKQIDRNYYPLWWAEYAEEQSSVHQ